MAHSIPARSLSASTINGETLPGYARLPRTPMVTMASESQLTLPETSMSAVIFQGQPLLEQTPSLPRLERRRCLLRNMTDKDRRFGHGESPRTIHTVEEMAA